MEDDQGLIEDDLGAMEDDLLKLLITLGSLCTDPVLVLMMTGKQSWPFKSFSPWPLPGKTFVSFVFGANATRNGLVKNEHRNDMVFRPV